MPTEATMSASKITLGCSKCGAALPDEAQFCLNCDKPISVAPREAIAVEEPKPKHVALLRKPRILLWVLVGLLLGAMSWVAVGDDPFALGLQEVIGWKHDDPILASSFSLSPHNFRYYKFSLPEGSAKVSILGHFSATAVKNAASVKDQSNVPDSDIEAYILSEPAFAAWQNGYATSSVYESGRVSSGDLQSELPAGGGTYYLVFSNKFAAKAAKNVDANVYLRYKTWMPEGLRRTKRPAAVQWSGIQ